MKKVVYFFLLSTIFTSTLFALDPSEKEILQTLKEELQVAQKIVGQNNGIDIKSEYRIVQTLSEILKIVQRDGNRKEVDRIYQLLKKSGEKLIQNHPKDPMSAVTHLLLATAINQYEPQSTKTVEYHFQKAIELGPNDDFLIVAYSYTADYYYNHGQYDKASHFYQKLIKRGEEGQKSKYLYNLAWCHMKLKNYKEAVSILRMAYSESKNKKNSDYSGEVLKSAPLFYLYSNNHEEGISFLKKESPENANYLISYANLLISKGFTSSGIEAIEEAEQILKKQSVLNWELEIQLLDLLYQSRLKQAFTKKAISLNAKWKNIEPSDQQKEIFNSLLKNWIVDLQKESLKKNASTPFALSSSDQEILESFLTILTQTDLNGRSNHLFSLGELHLFQKKYSEAMNNYEEAYKSTGNDQLQSKIADSMLAVLSESNENTFSQQKIKSIYTFYIGQGKNRNNLLLVYNKLFNFYIKNQQPDEAEKTINLFRERFPDELQKQQELLIRLLDFYMKKEDFASYGQLLKKLEGPSYRFSPEQLAKFNTLMGLYLFDETEKLVKNKKFEEAISNYQKYYQNDRFSKEIRLKSAYNLTLLYLQLEQEKKTIEWAERWYQLLNPNERASQISVIAKIGETFLANDNQQASIILNQKILQINCKEGQLVLNSDLMIDTAYLFEAISDDKLISFLKQFDQCVEPKIISSLIDQLAYNALSIERSNTFFSFFQTFGDDPVYKNTLLLYMSQLYLLSLSEDDKKIQNRSLSELKNAYRKSGYDKKTLKKVDALFLLIEIIEEEKNLHTPQFTFPEDRFGEILGQRSQKLENYSKQIETILGAQDAGSSLMAYTRLLKAHQIFLTDLQTFTPPLKGGDLKNYKQSIQEITSPLEKKIEKMRFEGLQLMNSSSYLARTNFLLRDDGEKYYRYYNYQPISAPILIEKGGAPLK